MKQKETPLMTCLISILTKLFGSTISSSFLLWLLSKLFG